MAGGGACVTAQVECPVWRTGRIHSGREMERGHPGRKERLRLGCKGMDAPGRLRGERRPSERRGFMPLVSRMGQERGFRLENTDITSPEPVDHD